MLIKHQALAMQLKKRLAPVYILAGPDAWLLEDAARQIKNASKQFADYDEKKMHLQTADDWQFLLEEANTYALFAENTLLDASYDKKTLDAPAKTALASYLKAINSRCLILIRAPELTGKQLQGYTATEDAVIVLASPLDSGAMRQWIIKKLEDHHLSYDPQVPAMIQQHTEGNMLACAQVIEKIGLTATPGGSLTIDDLLLQLSNQSHYQLFDLTAACLQGDANKAITILRQARDTSLEATLVLWALSNEIRLLLQLRQKIHQKIAFNEACSQLNIWSSRCASYEKMLKRLAKTKLPELLSTCYSIDEQIKSGQKLKIWHNFEFIALTLCLGS